MAVGYQNTGTNAALGTELLVIALYKSCLINPNNSMPRGFRMTASTLPVLSPFTSTTASTAAQLLQYGAWQFYFNTIGVSAGWTVVFE